MGKATVQYRYGRRPKQMPPAGEYTEQRAMWAKFGKHEVVLYLDNSGEQVGGEVIITFYNSRKSWAINLSECTVADLDAMKSVIDRAFELAYPVAEARDRKAQDDFDAGVDSNPRSYRQLPQFVVRDRVFAEHGPFLQVRPTDIPVLDGNDGSGHATAGSASGLSGSDGGDVAERDASGSSAEDYLQAADQSAGVLRVGGYPVSDIGKVQAADTPQD